MKVRQKKEMSFRKNPNLKMSDVLLKVVQCALRKGQCFLIALLLKCQVSCDVLQVIWQLPWNNELFLDNRICQKKKEETIKRFYLSVFLVLYWKKFMVTFFTSLWTHSSGTIEMTDFKYNMLKYALS